MRRHQQKQQLGNTLCFFSKVQRLLSCQIILGILIFHITNQSLSKAVALTSSGYVEICSLSETEIELQYDAQKGEFVQLELDEDSSTTTTTTTTTTDKDVEQAEEGMHGSSSKPNKKGGKTRTLQLRKESHSSHSSSSSSSSKLKQRRHIMSQKQPEQSNYNDNNNIMIARECKCVSHYRREKSYCLIHSNENYCQIPTSSNDPIECFHSSMYLVFVRNLWPLSLLWLLALTFYLISTEAGRSTYKYFFSQVCCCFTDMCNNSRLINNIISRETSLRELYQVASLTREEQELQSAAVRNNSTVITYILKTKEFFSGKTTTTTTTTTTSSGAKESTSCSSGSTVELTKQCQRSGNKCSADNDIFESPSNETLLTSPDSFGSSPSSDNDISPMTATPTATGAISTSPTNEEDENHDGRVHEQNTNVSLSDIHNDINKSSDNIQDNIVDDDEEEEENLCTICMVDIEDGNRVGVLSCGHLFHADCLKEWIKRRNACPLCQTQVAEERADPNNNERNAENARVRYPTTFTVRTTGSPVESMIRRSRARRRGAGTRTSDLRNEDTTRRQLFVVNGNSRIPPSLSSSAGVTLISTRMVSPSNQRNGGNQQRRVLVGDASRTSTGRSHRNDNGVMLERRPMRMTSLLQARNNQS